MKSKLETIKKTLYEIEPAKLAKLVQTDQGAKEYWFQILEFAQAVSLASPAEGHALPEEMVHDEYEDTYIAPSVAQRTQDHKNLHRTWGLSLLKRDALGSGGHVFDFLKESRQELSSMDDAKTCSAAKDRFEEELKSLTNIDEVLAYAMSGSDVVNLAFNLAIYAGRKRLLAPGGKEAEVLKKVPRLVFFHGMYGAGRGGAAMINWAKWGTDSAVDLRQWTLPSPTTILPPEEQKYLSSWENKRLDDLEGQALMRLRSLDLKEEGVGAILLEPVQGSAGVRFYRPAFLKRLQEFAKKRHIPIIADEVLTGGGRTGKFFAYEHYKDFDPDYVTFGKGLQIAGLARLKSKNNEHAVYSIDGYNIGIVTNQASAPLLLKGAEVLRIVRTRKLVKRAAKWGPKIIFKLREAQRRDTESAEASGVGFFIGAVLPEGLGLKTIAEDAPDIFDKENLPKRQRLIPPLDLSDEEIKDLLGTIEKASWTAVKDEVRAVWNNDVRDFDTYLMSWNGKTMEQIKKSFAKTNFFHGLKYGADSENLDKARRSAFFVNRTKVVPSFDDFSIGYKSKEKPKSKE